MSALTLNPQQELFCREYSKHGHGERAVVAAGYNVKTWEKDGSSSASVVANQLLKHLKIRQRIQQLQEQRARRADVSVEYVLTKLKTVVRRGLQEVRPILTPDGEPTGEFEYDSMGVTNALKQIGTYLGMYDNKLALPTGDTYNTQINFYVPENNRVRESQVINGSSRSKPECATILPENGRSAHNGSH